MGRCGARLCTGNLLFYVYSSLAFTGFKLKYRGKEGRKKERKKGRKEERKKEKKKKRRKERKKEIINE